jgi:PKD repeat protein
METKTAYITVYTPIVAEFTYTPTIGIAPLEVQFTNASTGDYDTLAWDFGDGGSSTEANPPHTFATGGTFTVTLTVTGLGGEDVQTHTVAVYTAVSAGFSADVTSGVAPLAVQFTDQSTGDYDTLAWDFGDGSSSAESNPSHVYTAAGTYTVSLTASGDGGTNVETKTAYITVYTAVTADFSADVTSGIAPLTVQFTDLSSGDYDTLAWDFGDGSTSAESNPSHVYSAAGVYAVSLTASGDGGTDVETKTGYITVYTAVSADFSADVTSGIAPLSVQFTDLSSGDYDTLAWDFGDGGSSDLENPMHTYSTPGTYSVSLTISGLGGSDTEIKASYITVYDPTLADFSATPLTGIAPLEVAFTNLSSGDYDSFAWDFGDGNSSTEFEPSHTYTSAGVYSVNLTIEGPGGIATETKVGYITVYEVVVAYYSASPMIGQPILVVEFTNLSAGSYETIEWDFDDGTFSDEINPIHSYSAIGTYQVTLSVEGPGGSDTFQREIIVIPYVNYLPLIVR